MMSPILFALFVCALVALWSARYNAKSRPLHFPPGPIKLPIFGSYLQMLAKNYKYTFRGLMEMSKDFKSPLLGIFLGDTPALVSNDFATTRALLLKPEFQGRPDIFAVRERSFGKLQGIFFVDGPLWAEQRRFSLRHMRDFGFGRRFPRLEEAVEEEVRYVVEALRTPTSLSDKEVLRDGQALLPDLFFVGFANSLLEVLIGERLPPEEHGRLKRVTRSILLFQRNVEPSGGLLNIAPWIRFLFPSGIGFTGFKAGHEGLLAFTQDLIEKQRVSFNTHAMRGFIDRYLKEINDKSGQPSGFTDCQLVMLVLDYIFPSATVTTVTMAMAVVYMLRHPDKADKAHREISDVVGRDRLPSLDDRPMLPYTEAFLREVLRIETTTSLSLTHRSTEDTWFLGYFIPKNTLLIPNIWAANRDSTVWERGDHFEPERFLDPQTGRLKKQDLSMAFGLGKRLCAGETFARQTLFLFLAALLQSFVFRMPAGQPIPVHQDFIPGVIVRPESFWVHVEERSSYPELTT